MWRQPVGKSLSHWRSFENINPPVKQELQNLIPEGGDIIVIHKCWRLVNSAGVA